jgi:hypothetical protein
MYLTERRRVLGKYNLRISHSHIVGITYRTCVPYHQASPTTANPVWLSSSTHGRHRVRSGRRCYRRKCSQPCCRCVCSWRELSAIRVGGDVVGARTSHEGLSRLQHLVPRLCLHEIGFGLRLVPGDYLERRGHGLASAPWGQGPSVGDQEKLVEGLGARRPDRLTMPFLVLGRCGNHYIVWVVRLSKVSARSADSNLTTPQGDPAPCHFNANPVHRVSVALSATLQLGCDAPNLPRRRCAAAPLSSPLRVRA